jgi:hypothetical protein
MTGYVAPPPIAMRVSSASTSGLQTTGFGLNIFGPKNPECIRGYSSFLSNIDNYNSDQSPTSITTVGNPIDTVI